MAVSAEPKTGIPENALSILCLLLCFLAILAPTISSMTGSVNRILCNFSKLVSWSCYSLAFYVMGISVPPHRFRDDADESASLACSAVLFVGLANSIVCRSIPDAYQNLCALKQQLVQMVFVLALIISPWSIVPRLRIGLLLAALFLLWLAQQRCRLLRVSARSRIKDDLLISKYMAKKRGDSKNNDQSPGDQCGCNYIVGGEVCSTTHWALQRVFLKHLTNFGKDLREGAGKNIPELLGLFFNDLQYASAPGAMASPVIRYDNLVTVQDIWKHTPPSRSERRPSRRSIDGMDLCLAFAFFKLLRQRFRGCNNLLEWDFPLRGLLSYPTEATSCLGNDETSITISVPSTNSPSTPTTESRLRAFNIIEAELCFLFDFFYGNHLADFCYLLSTFGFTVWTTSLFFVYNCWTDVYRAQGIVFPLFGAFQLLQSFSSWQMINLLVYICQRLKRSSLSQGRSMLGPVSDRILGVLMSFLINSHIFHTARILSSHIARQYCLLLHDDFPRFTSIKIPIKAKEALITALLNALHNRKGILSDGKSSLFRNGQYRQLSWACRHDCVAEKIIVWHVATTLCNVGYAVHHPTRSLRQAGTTGIDEDNEVATMLSGYCAYLVAFVPELIADDIYTTRLVFDNARAAALERVSGEGSLAKMCESAKKIAFGGNGTNFAAVTKLDVVFQGKMLASQLVNLEDNIRWKVLAGFWAELMLFVSPGDKAAAHLTKLKDGGEFITHIWALLKHAGIPERPSDQHDNAGKQRSQIIEQDDIEFSICESDLQQEQDDSDIEAGKQEQDDDSDIEAGKQEQDDDSDIEAKQQEKDDTIIEEHEIEIYIA